MSQHYSLICRRALRRKSKLVLEKRLLPHSTKLPGILNAIIKVRAGTCFRVIVELNFIGF